MLYHLRILFEDGGIQTRWCNEDTLGPYFDIPFLLSLKITKKQRNRIKKGLRE